MIPATPLRMKRSGSGSCRLQLRREGGRRSPRPRSSTSRTEIGLLAGLDGDAGVERRHTRPARDSGDETDGQAGAPTGAGHAHEGSFCDEDRTDRTSTVRGAHSSKSRPDGRVKGPFGPWRCAGGPWRTGAGCGRCGGGRQPSDIRDGQRGSTMHVSLSAKPGSPAGPGAPHRRPVWLAAGHRPSASTAGPDTWPRTSRRCSPGTPGCNHHREDLLPYWDMPDGVRRPGRQLPVLPGPCRRARARARPDTNRGLSTLGRGVYGYSMSFMLTGDERYLDAAPGPGWTGSRRNAEDEVNGGYFGELARSTAHPVDPLGTQGRLRPRLGRDGLRGVLQRDPRPGGRGQAARDPRPDLRPRTTTDGYDRADGSWTR